MGGKDSVVDWLGECESTGGLSEIELFRDGRFEELLDLRRLKRLVARLRDSWGKCMPPVEGGVVGSVVSANLML